MDTQAILKEVSAELARLQEVRNLLAGGSPPIRKSHSSARKGNRVSAEGRARIAEAQKRRWAAVRRAA